MKFITFYFSGTGNTKWAVSQFNRILAERGHQSEIIPLEQENLEEPPVLEDLLQQADYIGFANPIYGANIPPVMRKFIGQVTSFAQGKKGLCKPVYAINTFGYVNAFGPFAFKKLLADCGFSLKAYANIKLCNNISTPKLKTAAISKEKLEARKQKALQVLEQTADRLLAGKNYINGIGPYLVPGILIRRASYTGICENYKVLSVDSQKCNRCMLCVEKCPTRSIRPTESTFEFLSGCTSCMRCYNNCPKYAILFEGVYADPDIYKRHKGI